MMRGSRAFRFSRKEAFEVFFEGGAEPIADRTTALGTIAALGEFLFEDFLQFAARQGAIQAAIFSN